MIGSVLLLALSSSAEVSAETFPDEQLLVHCLEGYACPE